VRFFRESLTNRQPFPLTQTSNRFGIESGVCAGKSASNSAAKTRAGYVQRGSPFGVKTGAGVKQQV
jgi:hypothetical protein